jgi:uncharacterized protein YneF (UPF0154 family)
MIGAILLLLGVFLIGIGVGLFIARRVMLRYQK